MRITKGNFDWNRISLTNQFTRTYLKSPLFRQQCGVGLIEILIAVLLISIGFLAAAQMQVQGMRNSRSSYHQSQAHLLANDIIDRMRINIDGVTAGFYDNLTTSSAATNPSCGTKICNDNQLAQQDLFDWSASLHQLNGESHFIPALPSTDKIQAGGTVTPLAQGRYTVTMVWGDIINGNDTRQTLTMDFVAEVPE